MDNRKDERDDPLYKAVMRPRSKPATRRTPMFDLTNLSEKDGTTLMNGLAVAAERFDENAKELRGLANRGVHRIAEQFERQAADTRALIERINDAFYGD